MNDRTISAAITTVTSRNQSDQHQGSMSSVSARKKKKIMPCGRSVFRSTIHAVQTDHHRANAARADTSPPEQRQQPASELQVLVVTKRQKRPDRSKYA